MGEQGHGGDTASAYARILNSIFQRHYAPGKTEFEFERTEIASVARELGISPPKNVGDLIYSFRYRNPLPQQIAATAKRGYEWTIEGAGRGKYLMRLERHVQIVPRKNLLSIKIPDATPEIITSYAQNDEQALLAKIRYNRLVDIFLGIAAFSLQNHLRTTVRTVGQIEIDEVYVGVNRSGVQFVVPVQAKAGADRHSVIQTKQDIACCAEKFPELICRAVSAQFAPEGIIAMFELTLDDGEVKVVQERHYQLVAADAISSEDLRRYRMQSSDPLP